MPLNDGAVQLTAAVPLPVVALTPVGAPGAEVVVNGDALAAELEPATLVATTEKVYVVPRAKELTLQLVAVPAAVQVLPLGDEVTL